MAAPHRTDTRPVDRTNHTMMSVVESAPLYFTRKKNFQPTHPTHHPQYGTPTNSKTWARSNNCWLADGVNQKDKNSWWNFSKQILCINHYFKFTWRDDFDFPTQENFKLGISVFLNFVSKDLLSFKHPFSFKNNSWQWIHLDGSWVGNAINGFCSNLKKIILNSM